MSLNSASFSLALQRYISHLVADRFTTVAETSRYGYLQTLLNAAGAGPDAPGVRAIIHPANTGAGIPDLGLLSESQPDDARPEYGVVEAKPTTADVEHIARSPQVHKYLLHYGIVLVTNYYQFLLVTLDEQGAVQLEEQYHLAENEAAFWQAGAHTLAHKHAPALREYLARVLRRRAPLRTPQEVARILASYAREARARIDHGSGDWAWLQTIRSQLESALGLQFDQQKGETFFRSSLIQTLFYGMFSAWVLWHEQNPTRTDRFDLWRDTHQLGVPTISLLFEQFSLPSQLKTLQLTAVLQWTANALNRVERGAFFNAFGKGEAVQYFYEPFLEAFDPELRKELGVWYTPTELVDYMVARVDRALREELDIADGLAASQVLVLDASGGTGAYLIGVMRLIHRRFAATVGVKLAGQKVVEAVRTRLFGFEILPAPFVVAHLQIGLLLASEMQAPLAEGDRASFYLTNALTGWGAEHQPVLAGNLLRKEYEAASEVKQQRKILVILGNPPYSGFAGTAIDEEKDLVEAYRKTTRAPKPQGQGLNDLYVRFFRMAERRIVEMTGCGVVCYISNYSWLDGLSHTGMRERFLEVFDSIWIDNLNGDKYRTGKLTPEGKPDPSIFSTSFNREGIQVGTAIATLVRSRDLTDVNRAPQEKPGAAVRYREFWGVDKLAALRHEAETGLAGATDYTVLEPLVELGYPFMPRIVGADYLTWPKLPELFPVSFPGVKTSRDDVLVDIDKARLDSRMADYFNAALSDDDILRRHPGLMSDSSGFDARQVRAQNLKLGRRGEIVRYCYRPFDLRWLYWQRKTGLLDRPREEYLPHVIPPKNIWIVSQPKARRSWDPPQTVRHLGSLHLEERGALIFPLYLYDNDPGQLLQGRRENLSAIAQRYLSQLDAEARTLFFHVVAVLHAPAYRGDNDGALRQDWPRIPLPTARVALAASAALGEAVAALLDVETPVPGVTTADAIRADLRPLAIFDFASAAPDYAVTAGWGYIANGAVKPGKGRLEARINDDGGELLDIYLNPSTCWRGVPVAVWEYTLGGYQVLKKWLSYREAAVLGRPLTVAEVESFVHYVRRIAALLAMGEALDRNYATLAPTLSR